MSLDEMNIMAVKECKVPDLGTVSVSSVDTVRVYCNVESNPEHKNLYTLDIHMWEDESTVRKENVDLARFAIYWFFPSSDVHSMWYTSFKRNSGLNTAWASGWQCRGTSNAPICVLHSADGKNRLTFASYDVLHQCEIKVGLIEETGNLQCQLIGQMHKTREHLKLSFDLRQSVDYTVPLSHMVKEWEKLFVPSTVPESALLPVYSTWYSWHQNLSTDGIEGQCRLAKELGCRVVIVDDGWQTQDGSRNYPYCGDWQPCEAKIPDMKSHVARVHAIGLKYMLWYSVPFVGFRSKVMSTTKFRNKLLYMDYALQTCILDPRFPMVREHIVKMYERALVDWDLDGFKLDFVDSFQLPPQSKRLSSTSSALSDPLPFEKNSSSSEEEKQKPKVRFVNNNCPKKSKDKLNEHDLLENGEERDTENVEEATDWLLQTIVDRLKIIKPDILIEFRQSYVGPMMRKYGNMFRAADCPNDMITNRERTLDIRLLCGNSAVHSDMLMWNIAESTESAALHLINVLFSVPQISILLDRYPSSHKAMLKHWLQFWSDNRDVLIGGNLHPFHPESHFPLVQSRTPKKLLFAIYDSERVVSIDDANWEQLILINGTKSTGCILDVRIDCGPCMPRIWTCTGFPSALVRIDLIRGLHRIDRLPPAGLCILNKMSLTNDN